MQVILVIFVVEKKDADFTHADEGFICFWDGGGRSFGVYLLDIVIIYYFHLFSDGISGDCCADPLGQNTLV